MNKLLVFLSVIIVTFGLVDMTNAELVTRGYGTLTTGGDAYKLIYDTELNITWLDYTNTAGSNTWYAQTAWASGLQVEFEGQILNDWRLPSVDESVISIIPDVGWKGPDQDGNYDYSQGYNMTNSEMGHLFYISLGNLGYYDTDGNYPQSGWGLANTGPFENLYGEPTNTQWYWSGTERSTNPEQAWIFYFYDGEQSIDGKSINVPWAIAVLDGDVVVPIPGAVWLLGSGFIGIVWIRKKFKK